MVAQFRLRKCCDRGLLRLLAMIDALINQQVNAILHHPCFQRLEASWRGLLLLLAASAHADKAKLRLLALSAAECVADAERANSFDQSQLFHKIYTQSFDQPGGEPFGLLVADYYFSHHQSADFADCIGMLQHFAALAAASFSPIVSGLEASFFGMEHFRQLRPSLSLARLLSLADYQRWQQLQQNEDIRFMGLSLPRILMRCVYREADSRLRDRFFVETVVQQDDYCWGNSCYAFAAVVIKSFADTGWFAAMRGYAKARQATGIAWLAREHCRLDEAGVPAKIATEYALTDAQEKKISDAGLLVLKDHRYLQTAVYYRSQSLKTLAKRPSKTAQRNASLANSLHYLLCAARFVHYIKVIMRNKIGSFLNAEQCEHFLQTWLQRYSLRHGEQAVTAAYPLHDSSVKVTAMAAQPGFYRCVMHLQPIYQFDRLQTQLTLTTQIKQG